MKDNTQVKDVLARVESLTQIIPDVYKLWLVGDFPAHSPGQFVNLTIPGFFLRRPLSIADQQGNRMLLIFKAVGRGTEALAQIKAGDSLPVLTGLGNGFSLPDTVKNPLLVGGGLGVPPLYLLAKALIKKGLKPHVVLGFQSAADAFLVDEFRALGLEPVTCTVTGCAGTKKGFVTHHLPEGYDRVYACGPVPMLKALADLSPVPYELSFEERMACGFGACMGCVIPTKQGPKRVCHDGPVFNQEVV